jgi:hypothetical protein
MLIHFQSDQTAPLRVDTIVSTRRDQRLYPLIRSSLPVETLNILVSIHEKLNSDKTLPKPNWDT